MSLSTLRELFAHLRQQKKWALVPLVVVLLAAGLLLAVTNGVAYVAPFVYALF
jgi:hypothetical protein